MASSRSCLGNFTLLLILIGVPLAIYYNNFHCMSHVEDGEETFSTKQRCELNKTLKEYEKSSGIKICIVTKRFEDNYSTPKNCDIKIVCSKNRRNIMIDVGYNLRDKLPENKVQQIIDLSMIPHFESDNFYRGIEHGISSIIWALQ